jgi:hypothetical protein
MGEPQETGGSRSRWGAVAAAAAEVTCGMESARCNARVVIAESQRKRFVRESTRSIVHRAWSGFGVQFVTS